MQLRAFADRHFAYVVAGFDLWEFGLEGSYAEGFNVAEVIHLQIVGQDIGSVGAGMQVLAGEFIAFKTEGYVMLLHAVIGGAIAVCESAFAFVFTAARAGQRFSLQAFGDNLLQQFGIDLA